MADRDIEQAADQAIDRGYLSLPAELQQELEQAAATGSFPINGDDLWDGIWLADIDEAHDIDCPTCNGTRQISTLDPADSPWFPKRVRTYRCPDCTDKDTP
jgi:hypothetical protein